MKLAVPVTLALISDMAVAAGKQVQITGTNDCAVWGDSETVSDIRVLD